VDLQPIAVMLQLMRPAGARRRLLGDDWLARVNVSEMACRDYATTCKPYIARTGTEQLLKNLQPRRIKKAFHRRGRWLRSRLWRSVVDVTVSQRACTSAKRVSRNMNFKK
jgi:hypothetical protein